MTIFKLTSEQWDTVATAMASFNHKASGEDRAEIEQTSTKFIQRRRAHGKVRSNPTKRARQWTSIHDAAALLKDEIEADPDMSEFIRGLFKDSHQLDIVVQISALLGVADDMAQHLSARPKTPSKSDPDLEQLQKRLISFWSICGGPVRSSTQQETISGPLVRFMKATYAPALQAAGVNHPSDTAIREVIRKIKTQMEDQLFESIHQVIDGKPFTARMVFAKIDALRVAGRLSLDTIPLDNMVATRAKWPEWWLPTAPGFWPVALDCWLNAIGISDPMQFDAWLTRKASQGCRVSFSPPQSTERMWKIEGSVWPLEMMQSGDW